MLISRHKNKVILKLPVISVFLISNTFSDWEYSPRGMQKLATNGGTLCLKIAMTLKSHLQPSLPKIKQEIWFFSHNIQPCLGTEILSPILGSLGTVRGIWLVDSKRWKEKDVCLRFSKQYLKSSTGLLRTQSSVFCTRALGAREVQNLHYWLG